ncbi:MAG TPA: methyltransferase domain-containing protein [Saprospiraceae bacterium]|nr:methyltransferase domain-containing protein [Lacibacter sp.]HMO89979.1 methyltransferase domain-containing protein [Lacibacter sp.]HMQ08622.1 methyltransferase domain-containing protein [Saprospiraceae bacterium]
MNKLNYLNLGCGNKYHSQWVNIDMVSNSKDVIAVNLLEGIPYPDNSFDVIYHSQVLEHIPKEKAHAFLSECYRVLKPNGILRVVLPDLESIVSEYLRLLRENIENPSLISEANYDWIMLELYDQTVRNSTGGQMAAYLKRPFVPNEQYVYERIGFVGKSIRERFLRNSDNQKSKIKLIELNKINIRIFLKMTVKKFQNFVGRIMPRTEAKRIGDFRLGGEIHMWMYDRFSLSRLLLSCGFTNTSVKSPFESDIPDWEVFELDVKDNMVYDPASLFMEARKI